MYQPIEEGSVEKIQNLSCWTPKPGYIWDYDEGKWYHDGIHRLSRVFEDCLWRPDKRWEKVREWHAEEIKRKDTEPGFIHAELHKFIEDCWRWRLGGYWFYNNDKPTYITGVHWYYLSCYHIVREPNFDLPEWMQDLPDYRDMDRQIFYAWDWADECEWCMGMNLVMKRRGGKTYISGCIALEKATRRKKFHVGIQSKAEEDAKEVFVKAIIDPFRQLPFFFSAISDIKGGNTPQKVLNLKSGKMGTSQSEELNSKVDYLPANVKAYDGKRLGFAIQDEIGKTELVDVRKRWEILRNCLLDHRRKVIGKALLTTTVDAPDAGGDAYYSIWNRSRQTELTEAGKTQTQLVNFIVPAQFMGDADKYGFAYADRNYKEIKDEQAAITDPYALAAHKRQFPTDEDEAFSADGTTSAFNPIILGNRMDELKSLETLAQGERPYRLGNFYWKEGILDHPDGVEFVEEINGRFKVAWEPPEHLRNLKKQRSSLWWPCNSDFMSGGVDPFDHKELTIEGERTMSKGAICFIKIPSLAVPTVFDEGPVLYYTHRGPDPEFFYEEVLMASLYYSCPVLIERNKPGCINHFNKRGYGGFLAWMPNETKAPGIHNGAPTAGSGVNGEVAAHTQHFIQHHCDTVVFIDLIKEWMKFQVTATTKFDGAMAFGFAKILQKTGNSGQARPQGVKQADIKDVIPESMYSSGGRSFFD